MNEEMVKLIGFNNSMWDLMKKHSEDIGRFLATHTKTPEMANLIVYSVKLILSELIIKHENYKKYPATVYSEEDFVDIIIDSISTKVPRIDNLKANEAYIDEIRNIVWSHIKISAERLTEILFIMDEFETPTNKLEDSDANLFIECLTVVWVECILRKREAQMLEHTYEE